ncbi:MAG TPA: hypothetical protein VJ501_04745 [Burkholderiaceae bacterium]|nr:hypothetical protein [Burkholderiaceae bacterium]
MTGYQEPPDGDFVAYIDELQRQSAARISAAADRPMHEAAPHRFAVTPAAASDAAARPVLSRQQAEELLTRLAQRAPGRRAGGIALVFGVVLLLLWLTTRSGALPFLIGIALVAWGASRLAGGARSPDGSAARQLLRMFRPTPPPR